MNTTHWLEPIRFIGSVYIWFVFQILKSIQHSFQFFKLSYSDDFLPFESFFINKISICKYKLRLYKGKKIKRKKTWIKLLHKQREKINPGGLDSRDQSRSRSRTSLASRLTFLKCRENLDCWDRLSASVEIESLDRDKNKNWDKSRLYSIEIVEICRDVIFQTVEKISTVKTGSLPVSRSRVSIETRSRQIETPRANFLSFHY